MLKLQIPKNRINALARFIRDHFEAERVENGWEYFHKGRVSELELINGLEVHALVHDSKTYEVMLRLDHPERSECSCHDEPNCEHIAAIVFALYVPHGRPEMLLQELKKAILVKARQQQSRQTTAKVAKKRQERLDPPTPKQLPSVWQRYFDHQFYGFQLNQQQSIELFHSAVKERLTPYGEAWKEPLKSLYALHLLLFIMRKIEQFYMDTKSSYMSYYIETGCKTAARLCHDDMQELLPNLDTERLTAEEPAAWKESLALISEAAFDGKESPISWSTVYRSIWWRMADHADWIRKERDRIAKLLDTPGLMPRRRDALILADAHFDVIEGRDDEARAKLDRLTRKEPRDFYLYLHRCYQDSAWNRMLAWLRWMQPMLHRSQQEDLRQFCHFWMEAVQRQTDDTEWAQVMVALLPRTYPFYTAYLMKAKRFRAWIDLQLANRVSPLNLYSPDLQTVEDHDPTLVLPLYHQAVERCIAEKNRTAYKNATRLLKKLNGLYKKLGRVPAWEEYMYRLSLKHSRLRALQEELRKGKWIP